MFLLIKRQITNENLDYYFTSKDYQIYIDDKSQIFRNKSEMIIISGYVYTRIDFNKFFNQLNEIEEALSIEQVYKLYQKEGIEFLNRVDGAFCGIIVKFKIDEIDEILAFTDSISKKQIFYYEDFALCDNIELLISNLNDDHKQINNDHIVWQILFGSSINKSTHIKNLYSLYGGTFLTKKTNDDYILTRYFYFEKEILKLSKYFNEKFIYYYRPLIEKTIKKYYNKDFKNIVCDISGGIDSSIVAGLLNKTKIENNFDTNFFGYHLGIESGVGTEIHFAKEVAKLNNFQLEIVNRTLDDIGIARFNKIPLIMNEKLLTKNSLSDTLKFYDEKKVNLSFSGQGGDMSLNTSKYIYKKYKFRKGFKRLYLQEAIENCTNYWIYISKEKKWKKKKDFFSYMQNFFLFEMPEWLDINEKEVRKKFNSLYFAKSCLSKCDKNYYELYVDLDIFSGTQDKDFICHPLLDLDLIIFNQVLNFYNLNKSITYRGFQKNIFKDILPEIVFKRKGKSRVDVKLLEGIKKSSDNITENIINISKVFAFIDSETLLENFKIILNGSSNLSTFIRLLTIFKAYE